MATPRTTESAPPIEGTSTDRASALGRAGRRAENVVATLAFAGVVLLPLLEIVTRPFGWILPGSGPFTARLTMWVGLLGAALAARDGKLLALATAAFIPEGRWRRATGIYAGFVGASIAAVLACGAWAFVALEREGGTPIAAGIREWTAALVLPVAFGLIAIRLAWRASPAWTGRLLAGLGLLLGWWVAGTPAILEGRSVWPWFLVLLGATVVGAPIFVLLGGAALLLFLADGSRPITMIIKAAEQLTTPTLPAIPLFTLAGFLLAEGHASKRLLRVFRALFGWLPGGTAVVTAMLCAFFTVLTGGSGVTILALGGLLLPALLADGYRDRFALGLLTASGSLGLLFPLALPLILYGIVANVSIEDLFLGGLLPGLLLLGLTATYGIREGLLTGAGRSPFELREALAALNGAKWELALPIVILIALFGGWATIVGTAALAALYAFVVQRFIHHDLATFGDVIRATGECLALVGGVLIILAVAVGLTHYLVLADVPGMLVEWTRSNVESRAIFLLGLNAVLLVVGCLMDIFSAIVVVVPLIVPIAEVFQVHPVHLGIIFVANLELGYLTPPVGLNLFLSAYRFNRPVLEVARATLPMLVILLAGVLLITYLPWLTMGLLALAGRS